MVQAKSVGFDPQLQTLSQYAKLLSHPARLAIVQHLAQVGTCISGDIAEALPQLSRTTVSQHLQELKAGGLIRGEIDGVRICYCLDPAVLDDIRTLWAAFFAQTQAATNQPSAAGGCC